MKCECRIEYGNVWVSEGSVIVKCPLCEAAPALLEACRAIKNLDPSVNSDEGFNEWGEADCFRQAQKIAAEASERTEAQ